MELRLPNSWSQLTLADLKVLMTSDDMIKRVSCVTNRSIREVRDMPVALIEKANEHLTKLCDEEQSKFHQIIELDGNEYGFIPNWDKFTAGEWIDMENYMSDFWNNADKIMSILYRPVKSKTKSGYKIDKYTAEEDHSIFEMMRADHVSGTLLFFWTIKSKLLLTTQQSLLKVVRDQAKLQQNGGGIRYFTNYRDKVFYKWMRLRNYLFG